MVFGLGWFLVVEGFRGRLVVRILFLVVDGVVEYKGVVVGGSFWGIGLGLVGF